VPDAVQPARSAVIVYIVVDDGLAVTLLPVVALRPVAGAHVNVVAPAEVAVIEVLPPAQITGEDGEADTAPGEETTLTVIVTVQPLSV
jgi:hypothetical protein